MMNKKLFTILFIAVFLIASVAFVSAAEDSKDIPVEIIWDDANNADRPDSITVNILHDGEVVDKAILNEKNSWKTTFDFQDDGTYEVQLEDDLKDYSSKITSDEENGFVITNKLVEETPLGASAEDIVADDTNDVTAEDNNESDDQNNSEEVDSDEYTTDDLPDDDDNTTGLDDSPEVISPPEKQVVKKVVKEYKTKPKMKNTGLPIAGLVLVAFGVAVIPFTRKK